MPNGPSLPGTARASTHELKCSYSHDRGTVERYVGHIHKFDVDIGYQSAGVIVWTVVASTANIGKSTFTGDYGGVSGGASVGVGAGANVLIGGFKQSIALQPISTEETTGLNVAARIVQVT